MRSLGYGLGQSQRQIRNSTHSSDHTVRAVLTAAETKGVKWPMDEGVTDAELERLLFPEKSKKHSLYAEPDYPYIHQELAKLGVTYAEACEDMKTENWLSCHVQAFQYFGGVTRLLILAGGRKAVHAAIASRVV